MQIILSFLINSLLSLVLQNNNNLTSQHIEIFIVTDNLMKCACSWCIIMQTQSGPSIREKRVIIQVIELLSLVINATKHKHMFFIHNCLMTITFWHPAFVPDKLSLAKKVKINPPKIIHSLHAISTPKHIKVELIHYSTMTRSIWRSSLISF